MNTKSIALTITFAAVAIAVTAVRIPVVFYPGIYYPISQIPIIIVFLLFGAGIGVAVGFITLAGQLALFPIGANSIILYPMDLVSGLIMFAGLYVASRFIKRNDKSERFPIWKKPMIGLTLSAIVFRAGIMPFIDYGIAWHILVPLVLGINLPEAYIKGLLPVFVIYNAIVPLYTVPVAYFAATRVGNYLQIEPRLLKQI
jgi:riboflavin transporter FmnP